jgi:hypothetical protein
MKIAGGDLGFMCGAEVLAQRYADGMESAAVGTRRISSSTPSVPAVPPPLLDECAAGR